MKKYSIGFTLKLPIDNVAYSNIETRFDWEEETNLGFEDALNQAIDQGKMAREKLDLQGAQMQLHYKSLIEKQEEKLDTARDTFIKQQNEINKLKK